MPENLNAAAYAANLSSAEKKKLDEFNKAYAAHKELLNLPSNAAKVVYDKKTPAQKADLDKNFGNEDPTTVQDRGFFGTTWHYTGGAVANAIGYTGSKVLAGLDNVSDFMTRAYRTGAIAVTQNTDIANAWDIANDKGDQVFNPGRVDDAKAKWGNDAVSIAVRIASGEDPEKIMASATEEQKKYVMLADVRNNTIPGYASTKEVTLARANFQNTLDEINAAKYSPGRQVANAILPSALEGSGFFYKAISGAVDAAYRVLADPLLIAGKAKRAYEVTNYALDVVVGARKVEQVFSEAKVISFWDQYGTHLAELTRATKAKDIKAALIARDEMVRLAPELGPAVIASLQKAEVPVTNADTAKAFFLNAKQTKDMMQGQVGRQRVIIPRLDAARQARVNLLTTANKVFNMDKIAPELVDGMFFGSPLTTDGIAKAIVDGQETIVNSVNALAKAKGTARLSMAQVQYRLDRAKAKFSIAPMFKDDMMDVQGADAPIQIFRIARLAGLPERESRLIQEAFAGIEETGTRKEIYYGLWSTLADLRGLNTTESGQKIVRWLQRKGDPLFSVAADDVNPTAGSMPSDMSSFVSAPSLMDIDRATARSGLIGRMMGQANKDWVDKMTGYWSFLTLAGPRYAIRNAGEDLMINLAIGESAWGIAKGRMLSTRLNTVIGVGKGGTKAENWVNNPLGVAMRYVNKKDAAMYTERIAALDNKVASTRKEVATLKETLKATKDPIAKEKIKGQIDELVTSIHGGVVGQTRQIFAQALTEGRVNRVLASLGKGPLNKKEADLLAEQIIHGNVEDMLSIVSEGGFNFATGSDYISRAIDLTKVSGARVHDLTLSIPQGKYALKQGERGYKAQAVSIQDEASMVTWMMRIGYHSNDLMGSIAVANLDDEVIAVAKMVDWMNNTKKGQRFLSDARLAYKMEAEDLAKLEFKRARENFVKEDGTTLNLDLLNKIRVKDDSGDWAISGKLSLDDLPTDPKDIPRTIVGPTLVPAVEQSQYTSTMMNNGWTWLGMANSRISREPLVINEIVKIRTQFADTGFDKVFIESFARNVDPTNAKAMAAATLKGKKALAEMVQERAISQSLAYIDNPLVRSQMAFSARNFARFYRATEDFYRRIYRAVRYNPESIVRAALTYEGVTHSGWIQKDDQGEPYFVYPGIAPVYNAVQNVLESVGIKSEFKVPFPVQFGASIKMLTPSLNPDSMIPTFSGPLAGASITTISSLVNIFNPGAADTIKGYALGKYAVDQPILSALLPAHVNRLIGAMDTDERNSQYASAWRKAVTYLEASGNGIPKKYDAEGNLIAATPGELEAYRMKVKSTTLGVLRIRFAFGFFAPASPAVQLKSDMAQWISDNGRANWKQAFNKLLDQYPGDYDGAMAKWVELFPDQVPYTVTESERKSIAPLRYAEEAGFFVDQNKQLFKDYPSAAAFLIPHKSGFSWDAYKTMKDMGLLQNKRVEDYLREVQTAADMQTYYAQKNAYETKLTKSSADFERTLARQEFDKWKEVFFAGRPLVQEELSQGSQKAIDRLRTLDELNYMLTQNLNVAPKTENKLRDMSKIYSDYKKEREAYDQIGGSTNLIKTIKEETIIKLRELATYNENTQAVYDVLFGRLLGD